MPTPVPEAWPGSELELWIEAPSSGSQVAQGWSLHLSGLNSPSLLERMVRKIILVIVLSRAAVRNK